MNLGQLASFIATNNLEDCEIQNYGDGCEILMYKDSDMEITTRMYDDHDVRLTIIENILWFRWDEEHYIRCGNINLDAVFKIRSEIIPQDISDVIDAVKQYISYYSGNYNPVTFDGYLDESADNKPMLLEEFMNYRFSLDILDGYSITIKNSEGEDVTISDGNMICFFNRIRHILDDEWSLVDGNIDIRQRKGPDDEFTKTLSVSNTGDYQFIINPLHAEDVRLMYRSSIDTLSKYPTHGFGDIVKCYSINVVSSFAIVVAAEVKRIRDSYPH